MSARYAVYYAPPEGSLLWQAGCQWLGRDAASGLECAQPAVPGWSGVRVREATAAARMYGFHATLKPPFHLVDGCTEDVLAQALHSVAARQVAFALPLLEVTRLSAFIALCPTARSLALEALANACVIELDAFRRPASADEIAKRRASGLTPRQDALLLQYGYPFVMEEFRFHLTLTDRLEQRDAEHLRRWLAGHFSTALLEQCMVDGISLFVQDRPGAAFRLVRRFAFGIR